MRSLRFSCGLIVFGAFVGACSSSSTQATIGIITGEIDATQGSPASGIIARLKGTTIGQTVSNGELSLHIPANQETNAYTVEFAQDGSPLKVLATRAIAIGKGGKLDVGNIDLSLTGIIAGDLLPADSNSDNYTIGIPELSLAVRSLASAYRMTVGQGVDYHLVAIDAVHGSSIAKSAINVAPGQIVVENFNVPDLTMADGTLSGIFVTDCSTTCSGWTVEIKKNNGTTVATTTTDSNCGFTTTALPPNIYAVHVSNTQYPKADTWTLAFVTANAQSAIGSLTSSCQAVGQLSQCVADSDGDGVPNCVDTNNGGPNDPGNTIDPSNQTPTTPTDPTQIACGTGTGTDCTQQCPHYGSSQPAATCVNGVCENCALVSSVDASVSSADMKVVAPVDMSGVSGADMAVAGNNDLAVTADLAVNPDLRGVDLAPAAPDLLPEPDLAPSLVPVISCAPGSHIFPSTVAQGSAVSEDCNNTQPASPTDSGMTYTCTFDQFVDGAVNSGTACTSLPANIAATFNSATGVLSWTPNSQSYGAYEIKISGTNVNGTAAAYIEIDITTTVVSTNIVGRTDAQYASGTGPGTNSPFTSTWVNVSSTGTSYNGVLNNFDGTVASGWAGTGIGSDPTRLVFDGVDDSVNFGTSVNNDPTLMFETWLSPAAVNTTNAVILTNGAPTGAGFTLRQHGQNSGKMELAVGNSSFANTYASTILADPNLSAYYRLDEASGSIAADSSTNGFNGTYVGTVGRNITGPLRNDSDKAVSVDATNSDYVDFGNTVGNFGTDDFSVELWFAGTANSNKGTLIQKRQDCSYNYPYWNMYLDGGRIAFEINGVNRTNRAISEYPQFATSVEDGLWHQAVGVRKGSTVRTYIDGVAVASDSFNVPVADVSNTGDMQAGLGLCENTFVGSMDEISLYDYPLTADQIHDHYLAGTNSGKCDSVTTMTNGNWYDVAGIYANGRASLYMDGRLECSFFAPLASFEPASTSLYAGATQAGTSQWGGAIAEVDLYSSGTASNVEANFKSESNRFRLSPFAAETRLETGLIFDADPAYAGGTDAYPTGCATTELSFFNRVSNIYGTLANFSNCANNSTGWLGTGVPADPYRLAFDGSDDTVQYPMTLAPQGAEPRTVAAWFNSTSTSNSNRAIIAWGEEEAGNAYALVLCADYSTGCTRDHLAVTVDGSFVGSPTALNDGAWHHAVATFDGNTHKLYVDGALVNSGVMATATSSYDADPYLNLGTSNGDWAHAFSLGQAQVFNRALAAQEVSTLCNVSVARFQGAACN